MAGAANEAEQDEFSVKGMTVVVTGGASGLGLGAVRHLHERGANVAILDLEKSQGAEVCEELGGERCLFAATDVTSEEAVSTALDSVQAKFGPDIRALVSNAGIFTSKFQPVFDPNTGNTMSLAGLRRILEVNVVGAMNVIAQTVGRMSKNEPDEDGVRGVVVMTGSCSGRPWCKQPYMLDYTISKAAIDGMTHSLAAELKMLGIRACTIAPASFSTNIANHMPAEQLERVVGKVLASANVFPDRGGDPVEFGHAARLCIENPLINGSVLDLGGLARYDWQIQPEDL